MSNGVAMQCTKQIEELAKKIGNKLGEKLFGDSASSSRKEDVKKMCAVHDVRVEGSSPSWADIERSIS